MFRAWPNHTFNRTLYGMPSLGQNSSPKLARRKVPVNFYVSHHRKGAGAEFDSVETAGLRKVMAASEANSKYKMERLLHDQRGPKNRQASSWLALRAGELRRDASQQTTQERGRHQPAAAESTQPFDRGGDTLRQAHHAKTAFNKASFLATTVASEQYIAHYNPSFRSGRRLKNRAIRAILNGRVANQAKCIFIAINPAVRFQAQ